MTWKKLHTYPKGFHLYIDSLYSKIPQKKNVDFPKLLFWKISSALYTVAKTGGAYSAKNRSKRGAALIV